MVKGIVLAQLGHHPLLQPHGELDTAYYVDLATKVAAGGLLAVPGPFAVSPLYVFFLAAVFKLSGTTSMAPRLVQILLGAAAVGLTYGTARRWFGERAAWVAAVLAILTGLFSFSEILVLQAALDPFLTALALWGVSFVATAATAWPMLAAGATAGLLALNRPNALVWGLAVPIVLAFTAWRRSRTTAGARWSAGLTRSCLFAAGLLAVLAGNAWRNHAVSGEWVLISSHGGLNLHIGNAADATGTYRPVPGITPSIAGQARDATRVAEMAVGRTLTSSEVSSYFAGLAVDWVTTHPRGALALMARKTAYLLNRTDVPLNYSYAYYQRDEPTLLRALIVGPWLLVPLGLAGLLLRSARVRADGFWLWASFVPVYALSVIAFFVSDRYRMPLLVPLCTTSGGAVVWAWQTIQQRRFRALLRLAVALVPLVTLAAWDWGLDDGRGGEQTRRAVWLIERGSYEEARNYVERIAPSHSHPGVLRFRVGGALAAAGRHEEAAANFRQALAIDGDRPAIRLALGEALMDSGRAAEAVPHLEAAVRASHRLERGAPALVRALQAAGSEARALDVVTSLRGDPADWPPEAALDLGTAALELHAPAVAEGWLRAAAAGLAISTDEASANSRVGAPEPTAVARASAASEAHEKLGVALIMQGRATEAIGPLETACRLAPRSASAQLNLAVAYAEVGRLGDARERASAAVRLDPSDPQAAALVKALGRARRDPE